MFHCHAFISSGHISERRYGDVPGPRVFVETPDGCLIVVVRPIKRVPERNAGETQDDQRDKNTEEVQYD